MTCYETKQYAKGIRIADGILKKYPNHGETQAMKGIIVSNLGRKEEAYELVKAGVRNDVRSHVCWHVYGLLYRADTNYKEASKCYLNALRIDPGNQNILRDLSWLQIQMRDKDGFAVTRRRILETRPSLRASWIAYAVAQYLLGERRTAAEVLSKYSESISPSERAEGYEESELLLFQCDCIEQPADALQHLDRFRDDIVDKLTWQVKRAQLLTLDGQFEEAQGAWEALLLSQPEHYRFHCGLQLALLRTPSEVCQQLLGLKHLDLPATVLSLNRDQKALLLQWYRANARERSRTAQLIILFLLLGGGDAQAFTEALERFLQHSMDAGMPSLIHDVCSLVVVPDAGRLVAVTDSAAFAAHPVTEEVLAYCAAYSSSSSPQGVLWARYLTAHLQECSGRRAEAMQAVEAALLHTPTAIDLLAKKARLLKHRGDLAAAAQVMESCRALDLQDRYLNNKSAKYYLRADLPAQAHNTLALFTKDDGGTSSVEKALGDMQCAWYQLELAAHHARGKRWEAALVSYYAVRENLTVQFNDLFDFHGYCLRKTTLRAYVDSLAVADAYWCNPRFQQAFRGAAGVLMHVLDCPEDVDGLGHLSPAERKKERAKAKKRIAAAAAASGSSTAEEVPGILSRDHTAELATWCTQIATHLQECSTDTIALYAEACLRRSKLLCVSRAITILRGKDATHPGLHLVEVKLKLKLKKVKSPLLLQVTKEIVPDAVPDLLAAYRASAVARASLPHLTAALRAAVLVDKATSSEVLQLLAVESNWNLRGVTARNIIDTAQFLTTQFPEAGATAQFLAKARELFPDCALFKKSRDTEEVAAPVPPSADGHE